MLLGGKSLQAEEEDKNVLVFFFSVNSHEGLGFSAKKSLWSTEILTTRTLDRLDIGLRLKD